MHSSTTFQYSTKLVTNCCYIDKGVFVLSNTVQHIIFRKSGDDMI